MREHFQSKPGNATTAVLVRPPPPKPDDALLLEEVRRTLFDVDDEPSRALGRYHLLERIGSGGMGVVYRARDPELDREVAIKVLHAHPLLGDAADRLVREAGTLAKLTHPNIVAVYDIGRHDDGAVFVVMELVRGPTLAQWLRSEPRTREEIVAALIDAGRGLAAAHAADIVHRDFKPSNAIVEAGTNRVRVLDFGLALSLVDDTGATDPTSRPQGARDPRQTAPGLVMGTPRYMAPEQHRGDRGDARSDQYSLCLVLAEALWGASILTPRGASALYSVKERGAFTWPPRMRSSGLGSPVIPRPIVAAILRGLEPDPARRWPALDDLLRVLATGRVHRRRALGFVGVLGIGTCVAVATASIGGATDECGDPRERLEGIWDTSVRERVSQAVRDLDRRFADAAWQRLEPRLEAYAESWATARAEVCAASNEESSVADRRHACLESARRALAATTGALLEADARTMEQADDLVAALPSLDRCDVVDATSEVIAPPPEQRLAIDRARDRLAEASVSISIGRRDTAARILAEVRAQAEAIDYAPLLSEVWLVAADLADDMGAYAEAEETYERVLVHAIRHSQWREAHRAALNLMHVVGMEQARTDAGLAHSTAAFALLERADDERLIGPTRGELGMVLAAAGRFPAAEVELRAAVAQQEQVLGRSHYACAATRADLAAILIVIGRYAEAEQELREALRVTVDALGPDHPRVAIIRAMLADTLCDLGRHADAESEAREALRLRLEAGRTDREVGHSQLILGRVLVASGNASAAHDPLRDALERAERSVGPEHPDVATALDDLGLCLAALERYEEAVSAAEESASMFERSLGAGHPAVAHAQVNLARHLVAAGRTTEARAVVESIVASAGDATLTPPQRAEFDVVVRRLARASKER